MMLHHANGVLPEKDERREIWRLLGRATSAQRIAWLRWCCRQVSTPSAETKIIENDGSLAGVFWDSMTLFWGSGLSMNSAGQRLVEMVRRG